MALDVAAIREDFPVLRRQVRGHRLTYLDSAATSLTPRQVVEAMVRYYEWSNANVHRGVYLLAEEATDLYEGARDAVARFFNWPREGVVFTRNATEATNLVAYSWVRRRLGPGDVLLTTQMEHHANFVPWLEVRRDLGVELRFVPVTPDGFLDLDALEELSADGRVRFFAVTHMSNVLATVNDVGALAARVRAHNPDCVVLVDGAQAAPHLPVDVGRLGVDFYAFSGHKMLGPTGIGVLLARPELLEEMPPFLTGGEMIRDVTLEGATWNDIPHKFEAGTPVIAEAAGLKAALDYLTELGMEQVRKHEVALAQAALDALAEVPGVTIHGTRDAERRGAAISFVLDGVHPHDLGTLLDQEGVCIRVGHHCAKPLLRCLGVNATARASFYIYNDEDDIPPLIAGLERARAFFRG